MNLRTSGVLALALAGSGCRKDVETPLRDAWCHALETSALRVDAPLDRARLALSGVEMAQEAARLATPGDPATAGQTGRVAQACVLAANAWAEAAAESAAFHRAWWEVRLATGLLVIEPPDALPYGDELTSACAAEAAEARERRQAATHTLERERARWTAARDTGLDRCRAAGWTGAAGSAGGTTP